MLGDRQARSRRDESGRGRDVDQARSVAAGAAAIGVEIIRPFERLGGRAQGARGADHLVGRLALHPKRDQHPGDLGRLEPAEDQPLEQMLGILGRQVLAGQQLRQRVRNRLDGSCRDGRNVRREQPRCGESQNLVHEISPETKKPAGWRAGSR